ncbi:MAG TPA: pentapeptide repeat-containing protein [Allosphingosinicella sp.]|nr:pentapeptide repeat-containing protein [Allosphingosinicella sp.]
MAEVRLWPPRASLSRLWLDLSFLLRIRLRIWKLRFVLWWRTPKAAMILRHWPKPVALIVVGLVVPTLTGWTLSMLFPDEARGFGAALRNLFSGSQPSRLEWREATQLLVVLVGIPAGFLLWLFRDINVSGTLENQRKDVNLKEFQEIQLRAAGAMDERLPAAARETLQIAALHQLRAFLRGEYGDSFRRPALELLRARFVASAQVTGTQAIRDWMANWRQTPAQEQGDRAEHVKRMKRSVHKALADLRASRVAQTERSIVREEWQAIFRSGMPLAGTVFDGIELHEPLLADIELTRCSFVGAALVSAHLEKAVLAAADLTAANLIGCHLEAVNLDFAQLEGAVLRHADLCRASLHYARLDGADLRQTRLDYARLTFASLNRASLVGASLEGADLSFARLEGANLSDIRAETPGLVQGARFDAATQFGYFWFEKPESEQEAIREAWVARGAIRAR